MRWKLAESRLKGDDKCTEGWDEQSHVLPRGESLKRKEVEEESRHTEKERVGGEMHTDL